MATVTQENIGKYHEKISVTLGKEDYQPLFASTLKKQSKQVNLPGFRKGKVPTSVLKKMYGDGLFQEEIMRLAGTELEKYIIEHKIEFLARPLPASSQHDIKMDMNDDKEYVFEYELASVPEFEVDVIDKATYQLYKVQISDQMVQEEVERFQYRTGEMQEPEEIAQDDNVVNATFQELNANGEAAEGKEPIENSLMVKYFSEKLQKDLMGKKKDEEFKFSLGDGIDEKVRAAIAKDLGQNPEDPAHKEAQYKMTITKVGLVDKPELNEEFFEKVYPKQEIKTEDAFRNRVKEDIQKYWDQQSGNFLQNEIYERSLAETEFDLPNEFLKKWMLLSDEKYNSLAEVELDYDSYTKGIRWELIFKKLVESNNIDVNKEDMEAAVRQQLAGYFGGEIDSTADWVEPFIEKQLQDQKMYEQTYRQVLSDKLFSFLMDKVKKEEKEIDMDAFLKVGHKK